MLKKELKLSIRNFQSISSADLVFSEGVNLIVGASNSGKTASIRAIKAILQNTSGSQRYIKIGEAEAEVTMQYLNNKVTWNRNKKESSYEVNDERYVKIGSSDLFTLLPDSGFVVDDKDNVMNIEGEWDCLFPFDRSGADLFKLYENVFLVSDSAKILHSFKQLEQENTKELQEANNNLNRNKVKVKALEEFLDKASINNLILYKKELTALYEKHSKLRNSEVELDKIFNYVNKVPKNLVVKTFSNENILKYSRIYKDVRTLEKINIYVATTKGINPIIKTYSLNNLHRYTAINKDLKILNSISKYNNCIRGITKSSITLDTSILSEYLKIKKDISIINSLSKFKDIIQDASIKTVDTDVIVRYNKVRTDLQSIRAISEEVKSLRQKEALVDIEIKELQGKLSEYSSCPTCGHVISN